MADQFFIDSGGSVVPVSAEDAPGAAQLGWVPASPKQIEDHQIQEKYGTGIEQAKAFGEHAASAATLGLSDLAERGLGVSAEDMAGREQANPVASGLGTAAGIAAPLVLSGGTSGLARAADASAPSLIAKAGEAVSGAAAKALPVGETMLGRVAARAAAAGAGSAVEGAAYGLGQVVHEAALGDPNLTAQSAMATIGLSSLLMGGLSAAAGATVGAFKEFSPSDLGAKISDLLEKSEGHSNLNATNARPGAIRRIFTAKGEENATKIGIEARDLGIIRNPFTDSPDAILERASSVKAEQGRALDGIVTKAAQTAPATTWEAVDSEVREPLVKALRSQGSTYAVADQLDGLLDNFGKAYQGRELGLDGVWKLKQDIGDFIYKQGKVVDPWAKELNTPLKRIYDHLDGLIEKGIEDASGADALKAWQEGNRAFEVATTVEGLAQKGVERSAENNAVHLTGQVGAMAGIVAGGPVGGVALGAVSEGVRRRGASALGWAARGLRDALDSGAVEGVVNKSADAIASARQAGADTLTASASTAPETVAALASLERMNQRIAGKIDSGISVLLRGSGKAANVGRGEVSAGIARSFGDAANDATSTFTKRTAQIQGLAQNPERLHAVLQKQGDDLHDHAPQTAQAMQIATSRAVAFLASKLPQHDKPGPLGHEWAPSKTEIASFNRYYEAVHKPTSILKQAAAGTLTHEAVEAVQTVYPDLFAQMQQQLVAQMATRGAKVPYRSRLMLGLLMGRSLDGTASPAMIQRNQQTLTGPSAKDSANQPVKPTSKGAAAITLSSRIQTAAQATGQRRD